jgi:hypothetical protein
MNGESRVQVVIDRCLTSSAPIGAIAVPVSLGVYLATPSGFGALSALMAAGDENNPLRILSIFVALNTVMTVSLSTFMIGRQWAVGNGLRELERKVSLVTAAIEQVDSSMEAVLEERKLAGGRKKANVPSTFRHFVEYAAVNPRLMRELSIISAGGGQWRLVPDNGFIEVWIERFANPKLERMDVVLFVNRRNPSITESTGRTLLRFAKLLQLAQTSAGDIDLTKLNIHLVEAVDVQRTFFIVRREVGKRSVELVLQYSRSIDEGSAEAATDVEVVEEIVDEREKAKFKWALEQLVQRSTLTTPHALMTVFRDMLYSETFASMTADEWKERTEVLLDGRLRDSGSFIGYSSSEFSIDNPVLPWEERMRLWESNEESRKPSAI